MLAPLLMLLLLLLLLAVETVAALPMFIWTGKAAETDAFHTLMEGQVGAGRGMR